MKKFLLLSDFKKIFTKNMCIANSLHYVHENKPTELDEANSHSSEHTNSA